MHKSLLLILLFNFVLRPTLEAQKPGGAAGMPIEDTPLNSLPSLPVHLIIDRALVNKSPLCCTLIVLRMSRVHFYTTIECVLVSVGVVRIIFLFRVD